MNDLPMTSELVGGAAGLSHGLSCFRTQVQRQTVELTQSGGFIGHRKGWEVGQGPSEWTVLERAVKGLSHGVLAGWGRLIWESSLEEQKPRE